MAATYDPTQLNTSPLFQVRFRLGDTDITAASFQDEEIQFALDSHANNVTLACIDCVSALLPRMANTKEFKVGPYEEKPGSKAFDYWSKLLDELKASIATASAPISLAPTGPAIFYYGMQSVFDHGYNDPT